MSLASVIHSESKLLLQTYDRHKFFSKKAAACICGFTCARYLDFLSGIRSKCAGARASCNSGGFLSGRQPADSCSNLFFTNSGGARQRLTIFRV